MIPAPSFTGEDTGKRGVIAAFVLFTTEPSDRALAGWYAADWDRDERKAIRAWVREAVEAAA